MILVVFSYDHYVIMTEFREMIQKGILKYGINDLTKNLQSIENR